MLRSLANTIDLLLNVRKHDELQRRGQANAQLLMLHEIGKAMGGSLESVERTLQLICESVTVILQVERAFLFLIDTATGELVAKAGSGLVTQAALSQLRIPGGQGVIGEVVASGRPAHVPNAATDPRVIKEVIDALGVRSLLIAPLRLGDRVLGVLLADSKLSGDAFTNDDLQLLSVLGSLAAVTEENAVLIARLKKKTERLNAMAQIAAALNSTLEINQVMELILAKAITLTDASGGSFMLVSNDRKHLDIVSAQGLSQSTVETLKLELGEGITGWVANEKKSLLVRDVSRDNRYVSANERVRCELAVPLLFGGELLGVINVDAFTINAFDDDDAALLETFAGAASVALRNARLFASLQEKKPGTSL